MKQYMDSIRKHIQLELAKNARDYLNIGLEMFHNRKGRGTQVIIGNLVIATCFVSSKFGPLMIFLKRWFGYTKTTFGGMHEYQEEVIA